MHPVGDAHYRTKNVYVNQTRDTIAPGGVQQFPYQDGTILVKESTCPGRDFIGLVSIMRKRAGSDPAHGDWEWVEYARASGDETLSEVEGGAVCYQGAVGLGVHSAGVNGRSPVRAWTRGGPAE